ncbi:MAG: hypothetical protein B1H08_02550 [Candidatus Omnitrophica bacterium 4484_171]|nr:MAG: hypothetical protein B1H08_02550 [Candidatus Omnitrophica bacterium 4484_171]
MTVLKKGKFKKRARRRPSVPGKEVNMLHPEYITGFCDGEASFSVTLSPRKKLWEVRPSFSVSQNKTSKGVLFQVKDFFGCGYIRPSLKDNTYKYEVRSLKDLTLKIVPHFEKYPLKTEKRKNFEGLRDIVNIMHRSEHLNPKGLKEIFRLMEKINPGSKKIYDRKRLRELMNV